ncbi:MAG: DUF1801 domain-containing protein [Gemmatimonadota bacterium]
MDDARAPATIDEYIERFSPEVRTVLQAVREVIKDAAPGAQEAISYQMPTFKLAGILVHFAAWNDHIGLYPTPSGMAAFERELSHYDRGKGSVQFPLSEPMPLELIGRIVRYRAEENLRKASEKKGTKAR